jgi:hypothetical protein
MPSEKTGADAACGNYLEKDRRIIAVFSRRNVASAVYAGRYEGRKINSVHGL